MVADSLFPTATNVRIQVGADTLPKVARERAGQLIDELPRAGLVTILLDLARPDLLEQLLVWTRSWPVSTDEILTLAPDDPHQLLRWTDWAGTFQRP